MASCRAQTQALEDVSSQNLHPPDPHFAGEGQRSVVDECEECVGQTQLTHHPRPPRRPALPLLLLVLLTTSATLRVLRWEAKHGRHSLLAHHLLLEAQDNIKTYSLSANQYVIVCQKKTLGLQTFA